MGKKILLYAFVISVPLALCAVVWQASRYSVLKRETKNLVERQEDCIENNKRLMAEITTLSSAARIDSVAQQGLGLSKRKPEEVLQVVIWNKDGTGR
jgi:cell division protein FtsL